MKRSSDLSSSESEFEGLEDRNYTSNRSVKTEVKSESPEIFSPDLARKKRRGVVEKRRRDRINSSLSELRRLVPSACEKQGSTKLEKAEILQMTVDHLKILHASGAKGYFETQAFATDYRTLGFRECLSEVAKYLSLAEGLGGSDPMKARLVSHLSACASQRDAFTVEAAHPRRHHQPRSPPWTPQGPLWAAHSRFCAELLTRGFPRPGGHGHGKAGSPPGRPKKLAPNGASVPGLFPIASTLSALQFPFTIGPLPLLPVPAMYPLASPQASKIPKNLWCTEIGAF